MKPLLLYINVAAHPAMPGQDALKVFSAGADYFSVSDAAAAMACLKAKPEVAIVISNEPDPDVFALAKKLRSDRKIILVTEFPMEKYSPLLQGREDVLIDHVIAHRPGHTWLIDELRVTLQKLLTKDIFGIDKYLAPNCDVHRITITSSAERESYNNQVYRFAEECKLGTHISKSVWGISEEMLMNAIYDAPSAANIDRFVDLPRTSKIELGKNEQAELCYGCDGDYFVLSVSDPFGLMTKQKLNNYAKKILRRADSSSIIDAKKGGAGLGLFKILYSSHGLIFNVQPTVKTEILAIIEINEQLRDFSKMPRSLHFFST